MAAPLTIRLHPADNVVVARMDILPGTAVEGEVAAATRVPPGHWIAARPGHHWVADHWAHEGPHGGWRHEPGHWDRG